VAASAFLQGHKAQQGNAGKLVLNHITDRTGEPINAARLHGRSRDSTENAIVREYLQVFTIG
jgi:hypothetical protein